MIDLERTLKGGQCFGWKKESGAYATVLSGRLVTVRDEADITRAGLASYFDMDWPYEEAREHLASLSPVLRSAIESQGDIHILRQDPWTVTISFLMSQNNNIKRITSMYDALCRSYGSHVTGSWYAFPTREQLSRASEEELRFLHFGYRARYIVSQCREFRVVDDSLSTPEARKILLSMTGIGPKVADCILLFGYHRFDVFPMDTWMKKVMKRYFPGKDPSMFAPYQALAQQYLFEAAQSGRLAC